jgi:hypothetical protein
MPVTHGLTGNRREQPSGGQQALVKPPSESVVLADESHQGRRRQSAVVINGYEPAQPLPKRSCDVDRSSDRSPGVQRVSSSPA